MRNHLVNLLLLIFILRTSVLAVEHSFNLFRHEKFDLYKGKVTLVKLETERNDYFSYIGKPGNASVKYLRDMSRADSGAFNLFYTASAPDHNERLLAGTGICIALERKKTDSIKVQYNLLNLIAWYLFPGIDSCPIPMSTHVLLHGFDTVYHLDSGNDLACEKKWTLTVAVKDKQSDSNYYLRATFEVEPYKVLTCEDKDDLPELPPDEAIKPTTISSDTEEETPEEDPDYSGTLDRVDVKSGVNLYLSIEGEGENAKIRYDKPMSDEEVATLEIIDYVISPNPEVKNVSKRYQFGDIMTKSSKNDSNDISAKVLHVLLPLDVRQAEPSTHDIASQLRTGFSLGDHAEVPSCKQWTYMLDVKKKGVVVPQYYLRIIMNVTMDSNDQCDSTEAENQDDEQEENTNADSDGEVDPTTGLDKDTACDWYDWAIKKRKIFDLKCWYNWTIRNNCILYLTKKLI